jgi:microcystin-dependent protein
MDAYIGSILLFAGNFAPRGWMLCAGQTLPIAQNAALFSILGTTYGGNGTTTFQLPDLRSRVPVGQGQGNGLSNWALGQLEGAETVTLNTLQLPAHNHSVAVSGSPANSSTAGNNYLAVANANLQGDPVTVNTYNGTPNAVLGPNSVSFTGQGQPVANIQPSLAMNYIICIEGIFPARN